MYGGEGTGGDTGGDSGGSSGGGGDGSCSCERTAIVSNGAQIFIDTATVTVESENTISIGE